MYTNTSSNFQSFNENSLNNNSVRDAWCEFIGRWEWSWFCTLTFKNDVHPERADKLFRVFVSKLNRELYGRRWYRQGHGGFPWVNALEYQRRGVIHFHSLFGGDIKRLYTVDADRLWRELAGFAKIQKIRNAGAVQSYVSKYVMKGGQISLGGALTKTAQIVASQRSASSPAQPTLPLITDSDAGGEYATVTSWVRLALTLATCLDS